MKLIQVVKNLILDWVFDSFIKLNKKKFQGQCHSLKMTFFPIHPQSHPFFFILFLDLDIIFKWLVLIHG
jgi:hypothetical protein